MPAVLDVEFIGRAVIRVVDRELDGVGLRTVSAAGIGRFPRERGQVGRLFRDVFARTHLLLTGGDDKPGTPVGVEADVLILVARVQRERNGVGAADRRVIRSVEFSAEHAAPRIAPTRAGFQRNAAPAVGNRSFHLPVPFVGDRRPHTRRTVEIRFVKQIAVDGVVVGLVVPDRGFGRADLDRQSEERRQDQQDRQCHREKFACFFHKVLLPDKGFGSICNGFLRFFRRAGVAPFSSSSCIRRRAARSRAPSSPRAPRSRAPSSPKARS